MANEKDVTPAPSPVADKIVVDTSKEGGSQTPQTQVEEPKGTKTPQENLYAALKEERLKRQELEDKLNNLSLAPVEPDVYSDEGRSLQAKINGLQQQVKTLAEEKELERLLAQNPVLRDKHDEFQQFRTAHPNYKQDDVVKLFLVDQGVVDTPVRQGLEKKTVGTKVLTSEGYTAEEMANLRKTNYRKYTELVTSGKVNFSDLK